ncbi:hypothetical protein HU200_026361 [Digitaria exilis]|uniref:Uncharacterized protein n=1 Tax=Digitaria exilis TaxID=1010633 RepID=A0A835C3J3_9POAL|nr:hypothetical protein HU200_026361 [Digitaria exilis]
MATVAGAGGRGQQSPRWTLRVRALSAALRRRRHGAGGLPRVASSRSCTRTSSSTCCG